MITVHFKNVGQGDSIIAEWSNEGINYIGIIDCHTINGLNPTLEYLKTKTDFVFYFIILSHLHFDHFSGFADLFHYCISKKIKVKYFYHSLAPFLSEIYNRVFTSMKIQGEVDRFMKTYDHFDGYIEEKIPVSSYTADLKLNDKITLSFLAPAGRVYEEMAKQISRKVIGATTTSADVNKLSTIVQIHNKNQSIIFCADAVKKSFKKIRDKIRREVVMTQVPHHGSIGNIDEVFWQNLKKINNCPAVFSVGDEPKDKLPNEKTVAFFVDNRFDIYSTNKVYGLKTYFGKTTSPVVGASQSKILNTFSKLRKATSLYIISDKFNGDKKFTLLNDSHLT